MADDVYTTTEATKEHSMRYIHITVRNVTGILNRIASLFRRKRYNMEGVSLAFDDENIAHFIIAIDGNLLDVQQVMRQLHKLHDVLDVYDTTEGHEKLYNSIFVRTKDKKIFTGFPRKPTSILEEGSDFIGMFLMETTETPAFIDFIQKNGYKYIKRLLSLV